MEDAKTQTTEPAKDTQSQDSYEKRYKDLQSHTTKIEQENAKIKEQAAKDKELLDAVTPFVNWDAASGKTAPVVDDGSGDEYVNKKTLTTVIKDLQDKFQAGYTTQTFRIKYPDMVAYEDLVGSFLAKTDGRRPMEDRIDTAVGNVKKLLETERARGREEFEKEKKEKVEKEAEASGLSAAKGARGSNSEPDGETYEEYIASRQKRFAKAKGYV